MWDRVQRWWHGRGLWRRVDKHGWTAVYVGTYESAPTWVYSIGFDETLNQPEVVVFDVPQQTANALLWEVFEALKAGALVLEDGKDWTQEGMEGRLVWRKVHPSQIDSPDAWFGFANVRREKRTGRRFGLEAFQLVLSDPTGRMPWDEGYDERLRTRQPALYLPAQDYGDVRLSPGDREALRVADERGWAIRLIDAPELKWAYTIGAAETSGGAELIAFLPSANGAANILHDAQDHISRGDLRMTDGLRWDGLDFECCWRRVHESQYLGLNVFFLAKLRHERRTGRREALEAYQLFLPDNEGRYPWEPGCHRAIRDCQPLLFEPFDAEQLRRGPLAALMRM